MPSDEQRRRERQFENAEGGDHGARNTSGEAGVTGALPAVMNAVVDALATRGVRHLDMPATTERIWRALRDAEQR